ncbi:PRC-barrel domain-containing protein [Haloferula chungangensis]|uniref:PRC-barrel domain-containing protein n=1 Tax=Haloferula chungangensis TaxID=1048331 RepID=A0ABW2L1V4_9BACT
MKTKTTRQMIAACMSLALTGFAVADAQQKRSDPHTPKDEITHYVTADSIEGKEVWDFKGNKLGSVSSVLVKASGKRVLLVINADELLEKDHKVAVPLERFHVKQKEGEPDEVTYALDTTKEQLAAAPTYHTGDESTFTDRTKDRPIYDYWEVRMERMGRAMERTGDNVESATENAYDETKKAVQNAADKTMEATSNALEKAADAIDGTDEDSSVNE